MKLNSGAEVSQAEYAYLCSQPEWHLETGRFPIVKWEPTPMPKPDESNAPKPDDQSASAGQ